MNSYSEVNIILTFFILCNAYQIAAIFTLTGFRKRNIPLCLLFSWLTYLVYHSFFGILILELIQGMIYYRSNLKAFFEMEIVRLFLNSLIITIHHGVMLNSVIFFPSSSLMWLLDCFLLGLFFLITPHFLRTKINEGIFEGEVQIRAQDQLIRCWGLLDTGNRLRYKKTPVIFIDEQLLRVNSGHSVFIEVESVNGKKLKEIIPAEVYLYGKWTPVMVATSSQMSYPIECILNSQLFIK